MDRAPLTTVEFAALRRGQAAPPLSPAQAAAVRRAAELVAELTGLVGTVRAHLAELEAAKAPIAPPPLVEPPVIAQIVVAPIVEEPAPEEPAFEEPAFEEGSLRAGELRAAFVAARDATPPRARPRWADTLLGET
jgi:hypothetical protein